MSAVVGGCVVMYQCETEVVTEDVILEDVFSISDCCPTILEFTLTCVSTVADRRMTDNGLWRTSIALVL